MTTPSKPTRRALLLALTTAVVSLFVTVSPALAQDLTDGTFQGTWHDGRAAELEITNQTGYIIAVLHISGLNIRMRYDGAYPWYYDGTSARSISANSPDSLVLSMDGHSTSFSRN